MSEIKHTPGPWVLKTHHRQGADRIVPVWYISGGNGVGVAVQPAFSNPDFEQANARLIAAAPDLLEALKTAEDFIETRRGIGELCAELDEIRAAIAKAEGRQP